MSEPVGNSPRSQLPGNSLKARAEAAQKEPKERPEKIVEGKVTTRKQPWYKKIAGSMIADDANSVKDYVITDVIIPGAKNLIVDIAIQSIERTFLGHARNSRRGGVGSVLGSSLRTQYHNVPAERSRPITRLGEARFEFDEIILDSRTEAVSVVENLIALLEEYGRVSVADLYDLLGVSGPFTAQRWGWTDLSMADIRQIRGGFLLDLPRAEPLR